MPKFLGNILLPELASDPSGNRAQLYYNTTTNKVRFHNGTAWADLGSGGGGSVTGSTIVEVFTSNGTWTKPANASVVEVIIIGGGGGGGGGCGSTADNPGGGSGGGGGGRTEVSIDASSLSSTETVVIGNGGAGGAPNVSGPGFDASDGNISSFSTFFAEGGKKGKGGLVSNGSIELTGGDGGAGTIPGGKGGSAAEFAHSTLNIYAPSTNGSPTGGGGGGYASYYGYAGRFSMSSITTGTGSMAAGVTSNFFSGTGGNGNGGYTGGTDAPGGLYGGGGGGGCAAYGAADYGGDGANGVVVVITHLNTSGASLSQPQIMARSLGC